jgi:hypothetical protein
MAEYQEPLDMYYELQRRRAARQPPEPTDAERLDEAGFYTVAFCSEPYGFKWVQISKGDLIVRRKPEGA